MGNQNSRKKNTYKVPPGAGKPDAPPKPSVEYIGDDVMVRWNEPRSNGGCPIIGYVLQFNRVDGDLWESYRVDGTECLLKNLDDTFIFRVVAENLVGYSEPSETSVPVSFEFSEPVLLVPLINVTRAIEFEKVELNCRVWGMPSPDLKWYLNGDEIIPNNRIFMHTDGIDYKLVFNHIKISDEGEVKVVARNLLGEIETTGSVVVEAPPRIKAPKNYEEGIICRVGENLRLKFGCHGRPKPEVTWYHDGEPLRRNLKVQEIGDVAVLTLENVSRVDAGEYTVRMENNIGEDVAHVLVTVIDRPSPPGKPIVIQLPDNSCLLEWEPVSEDVSTYIIEYFRDGWGVWLKALSTRNRGCKIRDLIPGSKYRFRVKAENHFGTSDGSEESVQIYIPESNKEHGTVMSSIQEDEFEVVAEPNLDSSFEKLEQIVPPIPETRKPNVDKRFSISIPKPRQTSEPVSSRPEFPLPRRSRTLLPEVPTSSDDIKFDLPLAQDSSQSAQSAQKFGSKEERLGFKSERREQLHPGTRSPDAVQKVMTKSEKFRSSPEIIERPSSAPPPTEQPFFRTKEDGLLRRNQIIASAGNSKSNDALSTSSSSRTDSGSRYYDHYATAGRKTRGADRFAKYRQDPRVNADNSSSSLNFDSRLGSSEELEQSSKDGGSFVIVEDGDDDEEESADFVVSQLIVPVKSGSVKISTSFDNGSAAASSVKSSMDDLTFDLSRNNTPDYLKRGGGIQPREDSSMSRGSSRSNLLASLAEFTDGRLSSESKENLLENPFYTEAMKRKTAKSSSTVTESNKLGQKGSGAAGLSTENEANQYPDDLKSRIVRDKFEAATANAAATSTDSSGGDSVRALSLRHRMKGILDTVAVFGIISLLGPLLFMNVCTFALFCLLLIKMTFM